MIKKILTVNRLVSIIICLLALWCVGSLAELLNIGWVNKVIVLITFIFVGFFLTIAFSEKRIKIYHVTFLLIEFLLSIKCSLSIINTGVVLFNYAWDLFFAITLTIMVLIVGNRRIEMSINMQKFIVCLIFLYYLCCIMLYICGPGKEIRELADGSVYYFANNRVIVGVPLAMSLLLLISILSKGKNVKILIWGELIGMGIVSLSWSRANFACAGIVLIMFLICNKEYFSAKMRINIFIGAIIGVYLLTKLPFGSKIYTSLFVLPQIAKTVDKGYIHAVSSARDDISLAYVESIKLFSTCEMIIGKGFNDVDKVMGGLWAHNDFLYILYSQGVVGLLIYIVTLVEMTLNLDSKDISKDFWSKSLVILFVGFILIPAIFNGLYLYIQVFASVIILYFSIKEKYRLRIDAFK